jgi:hypothetical protein
MLSIKLFMTFSYLHCQMSCIRDQQKQFVDELFLLCLVLNTGSSILVISFVQQIFLFGAAICFTRGHCPHRLGSC